MHNLQLTDDQTLILDTVKKFVQDAVAPHALERDEHRQFAREELAGLAELGLFGLPVPEDKGGVGMGLVPFAAACEEIAAHSGSLARLLTVQVQCALALAHGNQSDARDAIIGGRQDHSALESAAGKALDDHGWKTDYVAIRRQADLLPPDSDASPLVVLAASRLGSTRLIDNLEI